MKTAATLYFVTLLTITFGSLTASARSFTVSITPKNQSTNNAPVNYSITITPKDGFTASVFLSASSPTLNAELKLSTATVNAPYSPGPILTVTPMLPKQPGTHIIIVEGKNGPITARDTCTLTVALPGNGGWVNYTTDNSTLPTDSITAVTVDGSGNLWAGTTGGLARFDGTNWYPIDDSVDGGRRIHSIAIDSTNNVWIVVGPPPGTLKRFASGIWKTFALAISTIATAGDSSVWAIDVTNQFRTGHGLVRHQPGNASIYEEFGEEKWGGPLLAGGPNGRAWKIIGHRNDSLVSVDYDGTFWTVGTPRKIGYRSSAIAVDRQNRVWVGSYGMITVFSDTAQPLTYLPFGETDYPESGISQFGFDYQGDTWVGTGSVPYEYRNGYGLGRYDGTKWWHYTTANSPLLSDDITGITTSPSTVWIGTYGGGLLAIDANSSPDALLDVPDPHLPSTAVIAPQIYPNPVDQTATVRLQLDARTSMDIDLSDALGRQAATLASEVHEPGEILLPLNTDMLSPGVYYLRTTIGGHTSVQPVIVMH